MVFKAFDERLNRHVVLKTFLPEKAASSDMRGRLQREAQAQARLQHDNIVTVYGLVEADSDLFIAMEYVDGVTLEQLLAGAAQQAMPLPEAMLIFDQILTALQFVHGHGVIHRDIKPANVMVSGEHVKLMDFGIALMADIPRQTTTILGTPPYMSPEQFEQSSKIDHRTDIYSAAIVLFEMVAGRRPFLEKGWLAAMQERLLPPPDLKRLVPELPAGVCDAVAIAMRRDPARRFQSIAEFRTALREGASGLLPALPDPQQDIPTVPQQPEPALVELSSPPPDADGARAPIAWIVSMTMVLLAIAGLLALPRKQPPPPGKPVVRTETVFVRSPEPLPAPVPAPQPVAPVQQEKVYPFREQPRPAAPSDDGEAQRREIARLRADSAQAFERAEAALATEKFDAVQAELDAVSDNVRLHPSDLSQEADELRGVSNRLGEARLAAKTREMEEAMWQRKLTDIQQQIATTHYPEAITLANALIAESQAPQATVNSARELLQEARRRLTEVLKDTRMSDTKNTIRKPSSPPRN